MSAATPPGDDPRDGADRGAVGGVAHDLNNVLTIIRANVDLLLLAAAPADAEILRELLACADRGVVLTRTLQGLARRDPVRHEPVDLGAAVTSLTPTLTGLVYDRARLHLELADDVCAIGDRFELELLVLLAVIAGVELVRAVGALRLRVETRAVEEPVAGPRRTLAPGTWAVLQLRAEGAPPAPHRLATLLDPASSGRPSVGSLVHAAAGTVTTRVSADATEVTCWLPLAASASRAAPPPARGPAHLAAAVVAARRPASLAPATPRVLVVDDEDGIRAATCALLRRHGFVVHAAASARAALTLLEREPVDLVLTDVAMPDMTGPDLAREVAARDLAPVLFMSGLSREELRRKGWVDGDQVVVAKPFASGDLIAAVEAALRPPG